MTETVKVFHHNDADGRMSAAIVKQVFPQAAGFEMSMEAFQKLF